MDWSALFHAETVVLGCGSILFGDDGLAPRAVAELAAEREWPPQVAFVNAGTATRVLLTDMVLMEARPRRVILLDVVQEPERAAGSIIQENMDAPAVAPACGFTGGAASSMLHHAPTRGLLRQLHDHLGAEVIVLTVQAGCIPELMNDDFSPEAEAALPRLKALVRALCLADYPA